jgi:tetratricopeptide (TPR) repeat protein
MRGKKYILFLCLLCFLCSCGPHKIFLKQQISSPQYHVEIGMVLFELGKTKEAENEFWLALKRDPHLVKAYVGMALVEATNNKQQEAFNFIKKAEEIAKDKEEIVNVNLGKIRVIYISYTPKFLPMAEKAFAQIMDITPGYPPAYFYMALVYEKAFQFDKALSFLDKVLKSENALVLRAYNEIDKITKIKKAQPLTNIGKEIGLKDAITRADMAALLVHELKLLQILEIPHASLPIIRDISGERFTKEIIAIAPYHIDELSVTVDGYFDPQLKITKASFCEILQDLYIRISGNKSLRNRFKNIRSPYKDLDPRAPYYNACILGLIKGFVLPKDRLNKKFGPLSPVSGADALVGLKRLRIELRIF